MLSKKHLQLLTAFVDGELTCRERQAVMTLLHDSSDARSVLQELQETAHRLRELPRHKLEAGFAGQVLGAITDRGLKPAPAVPQTTSHFAANWAGYAVAASIVVIVGVGILINVLDRPNKTAPFTVIVTKTSVPAPDSEPAPAVPLKLAFADLTQAPKRVELAQRLGKDTAVHLDVSVRDRAEAIKQLERALIVQGIRTIVDARAQASLKNPGQGKVEYVVYAENIGAEELGKLLSDLGGPAKEKGSTFESLVVSSLDEGHRNQLSGLMGVPASEFQMPVRRSSNKTPDNSPLNNAFNNAKTERLAMVMAFDPGHANAAAEAKAFLAARQQQRPGSVSVLLVIRQA